MKRKKYLAALAASALLLACSAGAVYADDGSLDVRYLLEDTLSEEQQVNVFVSVEQPDQAIENAVLVYEENGAQLTAEASDIIENSMVFELSGTAARELKVE